jgi:intein/homing endonuclease
VLKLQNIFQIIEKKTGKMKIEQKEWKIDLIKQEKKRRNGIEVMNDYNGTKNIFWTIKTVFLRRKNTFVFSVQKNIYRTEISLLSFVLTIARQIIERNHELMTKKELVLAEMITYAINTRSERNVDLVSKEYHWEEFVYDIEVEWVHNYYANGFLVHNCDAFRYLANVYADLTKHKAQAITYEADYSQFY